MNGGSFFLLAPVDCRLIVDWEKEKEFPRRLKIFFLQKELNFVFFTAFSMVVIGGRLLKCKKSFFLVGPRRLSID